MTLTAEEYKEIIDNAIKLENWCPIFTPNQELFFVGNKEKPIATEPIVNIFVEENKLFVQQADDHKTFHLVGNPECWTDDKIDSTTVILLQKEKLDEFWQNFDLKQAATCFDGIMDEIVGENNKSSTETNQAITISHVDASAVPATEANNTNDNVTSWLKQVPSISSTSQNKPAQMSTFCQNNVNKRLSQTTEKSYAHPTIAPPTDFVDTPDNLARTTQNFNPLPQKNPKSPPPQTAIFQ